jgi:hypothetical protein
MRISEVVSGYAPRLSAMKACHEEDGMRARGRGVGIGDEVTVYQ